MRYISDYLLILIFTLLVTLPLEFFSKNGIYRQIGKTLKAISLPFVAFIVFDIIFAKTNLWSFSEKHTYKFRILELPSEEILFFLVIPLAGLLTYNAVSRLRINKNNKTSWLKWFIFTIAYISIGLLAYQLRVNSLTLSTPKRIAPYYTLYVIFMLLIFIIWIMNDKDKLDFIKSKNFFYSIIICLFFMIIVNGFLTKLTDPIVSYRANLGPRIFFDMPVEDIFYGFILLAWVLIRFNVKTIQESKK